MSEPIHLLLLLTLLLINIGLIANTLYDYLNGQGSGIKCTIKATCSLINVTFILWVNEIYLIP